MLSRVSSLAFVISHGGDVHLNDDDYSDCRCSFLVTLKLQCAAVCCGVLQCVAV